MHAEAEHHHADGKRVEDLRLITGNGKYASDWNAPGQLYGYFVRADIAHADIVSVDTSKALAAPGVKVERPSPLYLIGEYRHEGRGDARTVALKLRTERAGKLVGKPGHRPCTKNSHGTYLCVVTDSSGTKRIYWNPFHKAKVKVANTARHKQGVLGSITRIRGGSTLTVSYAPVMVYH